MQSFGAATGAARVAGQASGDIGLSGAATGAARATGQATS
jgi:hypothetical protein